MRDASRFTRVGDVASLSNLRVFGEDLPVYSSVSEMSAKVTELSEKP